MTNSEKKRISRPARSSRRHHKESTDSENVAKRSSRSSSRSAAQAQMAPPMDEVPDVADMVEETRPRRSRTKSKASASVDADALASTTSVVSQIPESQSLTVSTMMDLNEISEEEREQMKSMSKDELNKYMVERQFRIYETMLEQELESTRANKTRNVGVKVWRSLLKELKKLRRLTARASKKTRKRNVAKKDAPPSGFQKPVKISTEMSKFTGWNPEEHKSRVDVTNFICKYIRDNNLQNPEDRRQILADRRLARLLRYDQTKDEQPLTYFYLQKKIQHHFPKN